MPTSSPEISLRALARALLARREDPYAADDVHLARRIAGLVASITTVLGVAFMPIAPPTAQLGTAGWVVAAAILASTVVGARRLFDTGTPVTFDQLYVLSWFGIASIVALTWLAGGGVTPYAALYPVIVAGSALNPPRRSLPFMGACVVAALSPIAFGASATTLVPAALGWTAVGFLITLGAEGLRQRSMALMADERAARELARADVLTELGNRRAFDETLAAELSRVRRVAAPLTVALFDLDGLKQINDSYGHLEGDTCLRHVATALQLVVRGSDRAYRWAGDEFAVLFPNTTAAEAAVVCERIVARVARARTSGGDPLRISYGVAQLDGGDPESLLAAADQSLMTYKAAR